MGSCKKPDPAGEPGALSRRDTARRLLNLLFTLNVANDPLTTDAIIDDPEIDYTGASRDARVRAFNRDRRTLAEHGVFIRECTPGATAKNEQRFWELDRARTHALPNLIDRYDAQAVLTAIDQVFDLHASDPSQCALQTARAKLRRLSGLGDTGDSAVQKHLDPDMSALWSAFERRKPVHFAYRKPNDEAREHIVDVYGMLMRGTHVYVVGRDHTADALRTFRTDRILSVKRAPDSRASYRIPADFDVAGFQFLPFDFSPAAPVEATFTFDAAASDHEIALITKGRGSIEALDDGTKLWRIPIRDLTAAASFALEHASRGMRAAGPRELVEQVDQLIERVVEIHA